MDLPELVKNGESETLEFKEKFDERTIESVVAFANAKGGTVLIGVSDKGEIRGVNIGKETLNNWVNRISQSTEPRIIPEIEVYDTDDKRVAAVCVQEYPIKPVSFKGRSFRRAGSSNRVLTTREIAELHLHSTNTSWDMYTAQNATMGDLDLEKVKRFMRRAKAVGRKPIGDDETPLQVLEKMDLVRNGQPTWAATLLFHRNLRRFMSQATLHCGRFKERTVIIDDRLIEDNLMEQVDEAMDFVRKNINVKFVMTGRPRRDEVWDYPLEAVREAIINAICHRDYTIFGNTEVRIYDNELVVWSPGSLPYGITLEELYGPHSSKLRNRGIAEAFYDLELIERWGGGMEKIIQYCHDAGLPDPVFDEFQGFRVIFRKDIYNEEHLRGMGLNERQVRAVLYVKEQGKITNGEYQEVCDTSERTATRDLSNLVSIGLFEQVGTTGKGTAYMLRRHKDAKDATKEP
ncbi:MAG: RNA-binding domain-containing protein [Methanosarcinaceae archaeon]